MIRWIDVEVEGGRRKTSVAALLVTKLVELANQSGRLAPIGLDLHEELENNLDAEDSFQLLARFRADGLQRGAALADDDTRGFPRRSFRRRARCPSCFGKSS